MLVVGIVVVAAVLIAVLAWNTVQRREAERWERWDAALQEAQRGLEDLHRRVDMKPRMVPIYRPIAQEPVQRAKPNTARIRAEARAAEPVRSDPSSDLMNPLNPISPLWVGHSYNTHIDSSPSCDSHTSHSHDHGASFDSSPSCSYDSGGSFDSGGGGGSFD